MAQKDQYSGQWQWTDNSVKQRKKLHGTHDDVVGVVEIENQVLLHDGNYYKD